MSESQTPAPNATPAAAPGPQWHNWLKFAIGFLGWYLVAWVFYSIAATDVICAIAYLPSIIVVMIAFAIIRDTRWVAFGILTAVALNFVISLVLGLMMNGLCLIPFFINM